MLNSIDTILVLAPHTDDGEFGCGGTIAKLVSEGKEVHYLAFSDCKDSLPAGWEKDTLVKEAKEATSILGVIEGNLEIFSFPVRQFTRDRQDILEIMVSFSKNYRPDLVLMPSLNDVHQDHHTIAAEGVRAFKFTTILSYEIPWNNIRFSNQLFVHLDKVHIDKKIEALKEYKSQHMRYYANEETILSQARLRGAQVGVKYAEVFEVVRAIVG